MSSEKLNSEILKILENDVVERHSFFQLKHFVIGKEPTIQSQLWRCIRELKTRKDSIDGLTIEIENSKDKKELLEIKIEKEKELIINGKSNSIGIAVDLCPLNKREKEINVKMLERKVEALNKSINKLEKTLKYTEEEALFFLESFKKLLQVEELKPFDDKDSQTDYWNSKFLNELNMQLLFGQPINMELIKSILSLKDDSVAKQAVVKLIDSINKQKLLVEQQKDING